MSRQWWQYLCVILVVAFPENIYWSGLVDGLSCFCSNFLGWTLKGNEWDWGTQTSYPSLGTVTCGSTWLGVLIIISDGLYGGRWKFLQILVVTHWLGSDKHILWTHGRKCLRSLGHDWPSLAQLNLASTFIYNIYILVGNFHLIKTTVLRSKILTKNLTKPIHFPIFVTVLVIWICGTMDFIVESRY